MNKTKSYSAFFCFLVMISAVADFLSDIMAIQLFEFGAFSFSGGDFLFPVVYVINDILTEVYGYNTAKRFIWYGLGVNAFALGMLAFVASLAGAGTPIYDFAIGEQGIASALSVSIAGLVAYVCASFTNAAIMDKMKSRDGDKKFCFRAVVSTLFAEAVDSCVFCGFMCVLGTYPLEVFVSTTLTITALKTAVEAVLLPLTKKVVCKVKEIEGVPYGNIS